MWFSNKMCLLSVISLALVLSCCAQNDPQDYVDAHNGFRGRENVGFMDWNNSLASYAQNYANSRNGNCNLIHSNGRYGENLAMGIKSQFAGAHGFSGVDAIMLWMNEKQYYNYASNSCAAGKVCAHYTQIVWRSSTSLGCARTPCNTGGWSVICLYNPPGNIAGQRPY